MKKRLLAFGAATVVAALPAVTGLAGNASFAQSVPVRAPISAQPVSTQSAGDPGGRSAEPGDDRNIGTPRPSASRGTGTAASGDVRGSHTAEPRESRGGRSSEPGDDRGSSGRDNSQNTSGRSGGHDHSSGRR